MRFLFGILLILVGLPLLFIPIIGVPIIIIGFIMILSGIGSSNARKTAAAIADMNQQLQAERRDRQDEDTATAAAAKRFAVLAEVDDDIAAAVDRTGPLGPAALAELREKVLAVDDKAYLDRIVAAIETKHKRSSEEA